MNNRAKDIFITIAFLLMLLSTFIYMSFKPAKNYSVSERRILEDRPELTLDNVTSGDYMSEFEEYSLDQFMFRDSLRRIKAILQYYIFNKSDNNKIYISGDYVSKIEYPLNKQMLEYSLERFNNIYETYLKDKNIKPYLTIIPDKNYYLAEESGHLSLDYDYLFEYFKSNTSYMTYIDLTNTLTLDDYYYTDTHWKQENIIKVAELISSSMGQNYNATFEKHTVNTKFYGVYYGQSALPLKADEISYLDNNILRECKVHILDNGVNVEGEIYNQSKAMGQDPYEMYLEGPKAVVTIENPEAATNKNLVIFRDSFASSLAPLLVNNYSKVILVDIRYIKSDTVGSYVNFDNCDVLFLYSTLLLNNSMGLK